MYKIVRTGNSVMYNPGNASNVDIKPTGLDFCKIDIQDLAQAGDEFTITLADTDPSLVLESQLYAIWDLFTVNKGDTTQRHHITPFFVETITVDFNTKTLHCVKAHKSYLVYAGVYTGELL